MSKLTGKTTEVDRTYSVILTVVSGGIFILIVGLLPLICVAGPVTKKTLETSPMPAKVWAEKKIEKEVGQSSATIMSLVSAILGGIAGAGISVYHSKKQSAREARSLILAFCSEMVFIYERCVMYYKQASKGEVSYSALFSFTDAGALSRLAAVSRRPETIASLIELKSIYYQIQRHVEEAAKLAVEGSLSDIPVVKEDLMKKASHAQGRALAFFLGSYYERIVLHTSDIVETALNESPGFVAKNLQGRFNTAKKEKDALDLNQAKPSEERT